MADNSTEHDKYLPKKDVFRIDEVATYFDVSERIIRLWIDHGLLTREQYVKKGMIRVTRESIVRFRLKGREK